MALGGLVTAAGQSDEVRLVSLVSAKLCHDLLGPLSALSMVAESLEDADPAMIATSRAMILESAAFDRAVKTDVLQRIAQLMPKDGYLFLGGAEAVIGVSDKFVPLKGERGVYVPAGRTAH
jgi:hypothetical protein